MLRPLAARFSYGVIAKQAALKDQRNRGALILLALISRARVGSRRIQFVRDRQPQRPAAPAGGRLVAVVNSF